MQNAPCMALKTSMHEACLAGPAGFGTRRSIALPGSLSQNISELRECRAIAVDFDTGIINSQQAGVQDTVSQVLKENLLTAIDLSTNQPGKRLPCKLSLQVDAEHNTGSSMFESAGSAESWYLQDR